MAIPMGDGTIDLSGLPTQGGGGSAPAPSGGATAMFNSSPAAIPSYDQWMYGQVFVGWGSQQTRSTQHGAGGRGLEEAPSHSTRAPQYKTPFALLQAFDAFSTAEYQKFKNKLVAAGFVSPESDPVQVRDTYASLLKDVQQAQAAGANVTPFSFVNSLIKKNGFDPKDIPAKANWDPSAALAANKFQPSTQTVTSVYDLTPDDAESMLTQLLQNKLGRDPSRAEIEDFVDTVKSRALNNPTIQTTKIRRGDLSGQADADTQVAVTTQGGKSFSTVTDTQQGFDANSAASLADRQAEQAPDYASYQAVATYMPALLQAFQATV